MSPDADLLTEEVINENRGDALGGELSLDGADVERGGSGVTSMNGMASQATPRNVSPPGMHPHRPRQ
jgi:hypothetical protein